MRFIFPSTCSGPRGPTTSNGEQNLNGEPSCDGRESAGPDDRGHSSARPVEKDAEDSLHDFVMPCEGREDSCKPSSCLWVHDLRRRFNFGCTRLQSAAALLDLASTFA